MIVGVAVIEIHVEDSQSLKAKRGVVRSLTGRLRNKFNISVGEVGGQGTWQRATLGLSMTGSDEVAIRRALARAVDFVEETHLAQVIGSDLDTIRMPLEVEASLVAGDEDDQEDLPWNVGLGEARDRDDPSNPSEE